MSWMEVEGTVRKMSCWPIALSLEVPQGGKCAQQLSQGEAAGIGDGLVVQADGGMSK